jgi:sec-independent protein translocase protein TatA
MSPLVFAMLNGWEVVAILAIVLVLFGAKKLPELARGLGQGIKEFKKSSQEIQDELHQAMDMNTPPPPARTQVAAPQTQAHITDVTSTPVSTPTPAPTDRPKA